MPSHRTAVKKERDDRPPNDDDNRYHHRRHDRSRSPHRSARDKTHKSKSKGKGRREEPKEVLVRKRLKDHEPPSKQPGSGFLRWVVGGGIGKKDTKKYKYSMEKRGVKGKEREHTHGRRHREEYDGYSVDDDGSSIVYGPRHDPDNSLDGGGVYADEGYTHQQRGRAADVERRERREEQQRSRRERP